MGLLDTKILAKLKPGKYPVSLVSFKEVENDKGGYLELTFKFPDRLIKHPVFPGKSLNYIGGTLRTQLGAEDEMDIRDVLEAAKSADNLYAVVSYNEYGLNLAFHEPIAATTEEIKA